MKENKNTIDYDKLFEEIGWDNWGDKTGSIVKASDKRSTLIPEEEAKTESWAFHVHF